MLSRRGETRIFLQKWKVFTVAIDRKGSAWRQGECLLFIADKRAFPR
jgi:hypothetical protein